MKRMSWISFWQILLPSFRSNLDCKRKPISFSPINSIYTEGKSRMSCFEWISNRIIRNSLEKIRTHFMWMDKEKKTQCNWMWFAIAIAVYCNTRRTFEWVNGEEKEKLGEKKSERTTHKTILYIKSMTLHYFPSNISFVRFEPSFCRNSMSSLFCSFCKNMTLQIFVMGLKTIGIKLRFYNFRTRTLYTHTHTQCIYGYGCSE